MSDNRELLIREAIRTGELFLEAQQAIALASDQRAINLCGFFIASAAVVAGLSISSLSIPSISFVLVMLSMALVTAAYFAFKAARPVNFEVIGYNPSVWEEDIQEDKDIAAALEEMLPSISRRIDQNETVLRTNAGHVRRAVDIAGVSVVLASIVIMVSIILSAAP